MSKTKFAKKLTCPAYIVRKKAVYKDGHMELVTESDSSMCQFSIDLVKTESLEAQGQLISHLRNFHNFYWKRHGKKLETRFSKQCAMRNK